MIFCPTSHRLYDSCLQLPNSGSSHTHSNNADAAKHDYQNPVVMPRWQNGWCIISWLSACIIHPQLEDVMMIGQLCFPSVVSDSLYAPDVSRHGWTTHTHTQTEHSESVKVYQYCNYKTERRSRNTWTRICRKKCGHQVSGTSGGRLRWQHKTTDSWILWIFP